ncbi:hypothetical protein [Microtetraspora malaysiensis]|uniref:hypothetical protein n=1 Tax=Microtetraspora malaysiensis TaxID=161358 RepID=UPI003D8CFDFA
MMTWVTIGCTLLIWVQGIYMWTSNRYPPWVWKGRNPRTPRTYALSLLFMAAFLTAFTLLRLSDDARVELLLAPVLIGSVVGYIILWFMRPSL